MTKLSTKDFEVFFEEINGCPPFHWQTRLAEKVVEEGWPDSITMPTGAGKTSVMEIAIFHLAMEAKSPKRSAPIRIFHTIDRRVVVDQAYEEAKEMAKTLEESLENPGEYPVANKVAEKLSELGDKPLKVERLRGGLYTEETWTNSPTQPAIIATTVDQVGSRLLFRGYGVSDKMKPIHAALVGNDSLIILDEAHLANPFLETLGQIREKRREGGLQTPFQVVSMSATLGQGWPDELSRKDREDPVLGPRLEAEKTATLEKLNRSAGQSDENLVRRLANSALDHIDLEDEPQKSAVGVIVNTVRTARRVYKRLKVDAEKKFGRKAEVVLVIGRSRPYEREDLDLSRVEAGRSRGEDEDPFFVVATQTIEVGADLDFDSIVTEIAPLDALRQRFGRLDRMGEHGKTDSTIITEHDWTLKTKEHPVYGKNLDKTWNWLKENSEKNVIDMGLSLDLPKGNELENICAPKKSAPTLLNSHLELLAQTLPLPKPEPEISLYLHGPNTSPYDIRVVWRRDLPSPLREDEEDAYAKTLSLVPPSTLEALELPIWAVKRWLSGEERADQVPDVEGAPKPKAGGMKEEKKAFAWRGPKNSEVVRPSDIRPGDTLIVPSQYGGHDNYGFNPRSSESVTDLAELSAFRAKKRPFLRLIPEILSQYLPEEIFGKLKEKDIQWRNLDSEEIGEILEILKEECETEEIRKISKTLLDERGYELDRHPVKHGYVLRAKSREKTREHEGLEEHSLRSEKIARNFAELPILDPDVKESVVFAAKYHDLGKLDPRFQRWMYEGNPLSLNKKPRAKSDMRPGSRESEKAREKSEYPPRQRHEAVSVALLENNGLIREDNLTKYLIGTHHGYGRPFFPVPARSEPPVIEEKFLGKNIEGEAGHEYYRIGSGWPELFWNMVDEYGFWGISYLEAFTRLADQKASSEGGSNR